MSSLSGFDLYKKFNATGTERHSPPPQPLTTTTQYIAQRTPQEVVLPVTPATYRYETTFKAEASSWTMLRSIPSSLLMIVGIFAFCLSIYVMILAHDNWNTDDDQDRRDMEFMDAITNLIAKDMSLMDKDLILRNNITSLINRLDIEIAARIAKDMILMANVTDINDRINTNRQDTLDKDMILMDNVTDLVQKLTDLRAFDLFLIEQFIIKFGNISSLRDRIEQEGQDREDKDMILMDNVTVLTNITSDAQDTLAFIENEVNSTLPVVRADIDALVDKDMILMDNMTQIWMAIQAETLARETADMIIDGRLDDLEARNMAKMDRVAALYGNLSSLGGGTITTINEESADMAGDFSIVGSTNAFKKRIDVTTNTGSNSITVGYTPYSEQLGPIWSAFYWSVGNSALPCNPCQAIACIRCGGDNILARANTGFSFLFRRFATASAGVSVFEPTYPVACTATTCLTAPHAFCDDNGANCQYHPTTLGYSSGAVRIPPGAGSYIVTARAYIGAHPRNTNVNAFLRLENKVTTNPPGPTQDGPFTILTGKTSCEIIYRQGMPLSTFPIQEPLCDPEWFGCAHDNFMTDDQPRSQASVDFYMTCRRQFHQNEGDPARYVMYRIAGTNDYEDQTTSGNQGVRHFLPNLNVQVIKLQ